MSALPQAVRESAIPVGQVMMRVYHLDDGRRIIDADDFIAVMGALEDGMILTPDAAEQIAAIARAA